VIADRLFSVQDRVVVVTGGLGRLGRRFTSALLERGARVAIFDVGTGDRPRDAAWPADRAMVVEADVTGKASLEGALATVTAAWEVPFGLVNNAALDSPPQAPIEENGPFESYPEASWDRVMEVNVKGVFLASQVVGGAMARAGRGSIVNISSIYGVVSPDQRIYEYRRQRGQEFYKPVAYSASKSALLNLTRYLATYWAARGVRVNTMTLAGVAAGQDEAFMRGYLQKVPLGRMAAEDEYDGALIFLLSEASRYMTGSNLVVDGGWTAW
jgi:NAD(P)-dependent dehydrogenase (short-subunit alcohol dehydrogenase family)